MDKEPFVVVRFASFADLVDATEDTPDPPVAPWKAAEHISVESAGSWPALQASGSDLESLCLANIAMGMAIALRHLEYAAAVLADAKPKVRESVEGMADHMVRVHPIEVKP